MSTRKGFFSLLQFSPDPARAEAINVGLVLLCPERSYLGVRIVRSSHRVRRVFPRAEVTGNQFHAALESFERRMKVDAHSFLAQSDLAGFAATRGNDLLLTSPRGILVSEDPEKDLNRLFDELVGEERAHEARVPTVPELEETFDRLIAAGRARRNPNVVVPIFNQPLHVEYAYDNHALNLVVPKHFSDDARQAHEQVGRLATDGRLIHEDPSANARPKKLVVVSTSSPSADLTERELAWKRVFEGSSVWFVRSTEIPDFIERVEREAQPSTPSSS